MSNNLHKLSRPMLCLGSSIASCSSSVPSTNTFSTKTGFKQRHQQQQENNGEAWKNFTKSTLWFKIGGAAVAAFLSTSLGLYSLKTFSNNSSIEDFKLNFTVQAKKKDKQQDISPPKMTHRERRFLVFASVEYNGDIFMTPRDFLDSVTQDQPRNRFKRRQLTDSEVNSILKKTPTFDKGTSEFFRRLDLDGLVSYTEYLFLLCILTKPEEGFRIAFNMFDTDGNRRVDKKEFLVIQALMLMLRAGNKVVNLDPYLDNLPQNVKYWMKDSKLSLNKQTKLEMVNLLIPDLETVMGRGRRKKQREAKEKAAAAASADQQQNDSIGGATNYQPPTATPSSGNDKKSLWDKSHEVVDQLVVQDTSLLIHFFGPKGDKTLVYDDFRKFMDNLQSEVLEIEFNEFSRGKLTITESDFAKILLRYTSTTSEGRRKFLERLHERIPNEGGITFEQFKLFCRFLNALEDFTIAVKLYTFADLPVSQAEFARAVKVSTGLALDPHVVDVVFKIFDVNNDGRLSYSEFIAVMKERLHRGFRSKGAPTEGWPAFRKCVREELKRY